VPTDPSPTHLHERARLLRPALPGALAASAWPFLACLLAAAALQLWARPLLNDFVAKLLLDIGTNVILAVSLTMVNGFTGQFSIGHAAFMAVGAYTAAAIVYYGSYRLWGDALVHGGTLSTMLAARDGPLVAPGDLLFVAALAAGGLAAAACGYLVGLPSLRLRGDYLAIVTLGFGEIVRVLIQSQTTDTLYDAQAIRAAPWYTLPRHLGGALGFSGLPFYSSLFWAWLVALLTLVVAYRLKSSSYGRAFLSIREDEIAAEAMGVHTTRYKVRAFVLSAFFAGVAGGIFAHTVGVQLNAQELGFQRSFDILIMVVLGGLGSISGAAIAAAMLTILPEALRKPGDLAQVWPWALALLALGLALAGVGRHRGGWARRLGVLAIATGSAGLVLALLALLALARGVDLTQYRMVLYALALILMMILRPQGLLGIREVWELRAPPRLAPRRNRAAGGESGTSGQEPTL